ncbi:PLP-dependent aminotransferase family protein [Psychrobacter sp. YP14]|uniref:aminotransferase-like domain-containing protein n=1 Tax=Psychrobacter sp. YP14 TaxID=2203895 RepID=UPI001D0DB0C8|nr:PLP-dependent aminotransferase family protein [Psychrobacter sp. YP14]
MTSDTNLKPTRTEQIMMDVKQKIATVIYLPGTRLPSIRSAAKSHNVSPSTVAEAYERLVVEGVIYSKVGSGFYVANSSQPLSLSEMEPNLDRVVNPLWISRQSLEMGDGSMKPGCGWLPADWLYEEGMRRGLRQAAKADSRVIGEYATPLGLPELRQYVVRRMSGLGIESTPEQVMLTASGTQAIDLICRYLLSAGDTVVVDDPCYFNFNAMLRAHRVNIVSVPYTKSGPDIDSFKSVISAHKPRLYITNATIHNPTGATLSASTAYQVLRLAQDAGLYIIEDDIFADFQVNDIKAHPAARLATLDGLKNVFYIGSFSKTISASLRCGFIVADKDLIDELVDLKIATGFSGSQLAESIMLSILTHKGYSKHIQTLHNRLNQVRKHTVARLGKLGIEPWLIPQSGIYLWCRLPKSLSASKLARQALHHNLVLAPGNAFSHTQSCDGFMRFNIAQSIDPDIYKVLARVIREYESE